MSTDSQHPLLSGIVNLNSAAQASGEAGRASVHKRTQLVNSGQSSPQEIGWKFTYWPGCAEASVCIVTSGSSRHRSIERDREKSDDELALYWQIANGRAGSRSRRYFVTNRLRYMWVLTYGQSRTDRNAVMAEVSEFARRLRSQHGGQTFPYWYSPELHPLDTAGMSTSSYLSACHMRKSRPCGVTVGYG